MKILNISQLLPIPDINNVNDFVFKLMDHYGHLFPEDSIYFYRPVAYTNQILGKYFQDSKTPLPKGFKEYWYNQHKVKIIKFISAWSRNNLHALFSHTIYWINKNQIDQLIQKEKISVVHAQFIFPDGLLALMLKRRYNIPYIITTHTELKYFKSYLSRKIALYILSNAYKVTPLNYKNYNFFATLGLKNLEIKPLGFDKSFLVSNSHHHSSKEFRIISVCELIQLKNIDKVIKAISILRNRYRIRYSVIGTGQEEDQLKKLASSLSLGGIVEFHGYTENNKIPEILSNHDLFILPSYPETFGRVYFEAMAAGLPVICAKDSGIYGYFPDLVDSYSVDPQNPEELAERIGYFIENKAKRIEIGNTLQSLVSEYTWDKIAKRFEKLYKEASEI